MYGLFIGAVIFGIVAMSSNAAQGALTVSLFWMWWYAAWSAVQGVFFTLIGLGLTAGGTAGGGILGGKLGSVFGALMGGGVSAIIFLFFFLRTAMLLVGSYGVHSAGTPAMANLSEFDIPRLVTGTVMVIVGAYMGRSKHRRSSN